MSLLLVMCKDAQESTVGFLSSQLIPLEIAPATVFVKKKTRMQGRSDCEHFWVLAGEFLAMVLFSLEHGNVFPHCDNLEL